MDLETLNIVSHGEFSISQIALLFNRSVKEIQAKMVELKISNDESIKFEDVKKILSGFYGKSEKVVLTVMNQKGGVGKTLHSFTLSQYLQLMNKKILVLDFDGQANLTSYFVLGEPKLSVVNYFTEELRGTLETIKIEIDQNLSIIPSNSSVGHLSGILNNELYKNENIDLKKVESFKNDFEKLVEKFDYVIIDTPPNLSIVNYLAIAVSNMLVIPVEPERNNIKAVSDVIDFRNMVDSDLSKETKIKMFFNEGRPGHEETIRDVKKRIRKIVQDEGESILESEMRFSEFFSIASASGVPFWFAGKSEMTEEDREELKNIVQQYCALISEMIQTKNITIKSQQNPTGLRANW